MNFNKEYNRWLEKVTDEESRIELKGMSESEIEDAFYQELTFGTGGLRGIIGIGTNRMNAYVVAKATQGLSNYLLSTFRKPSVVIGYDSRILSDEFAKVAACVFAANGIKVYFWPELLPVPTVSFAIRELHASAGVMITASHNPSSYNGYKVYGPDGCQITTDAASDIFAEIKKVDFFDGVNKSDWNKSINSNEIEFINSDVFSNYIEEVKRQSVLFGDIVNKELSIVYSPLNGTGLVPVLRVLEESGYTSINVVEEQRNPDGNFPTCPFPNPEIREAMELGLEYCKKLGADLLLATDPDCDRCGIAVKEGGGYVLLTGNEVGILLLDYICAQRIKHNRMPKNPVFIKTIVTTDLAERIAEHYGVESINVLTGFKFIGEKIGKLEEEGRGNDYICGFEESYGYLTGSYVRDKDAVNAAFMICEMFAYYKTRGISLPQKLKELYSTYGYCMDTLHSYEFPGSSGMFKMQAIMNGFHKGLKQIAGYQVVASEDYSNGLNGLPKSDVLKFCMNNGSVVIRPSGTEPKLKVYVSVTAKDKETALEVEKAIVDCIKEYIEV